MFVLYLAVQVFFVQQISLFGYAFCFIYIACILLLPFDTSQVTLLLLAFVAGFLVDMFSDTLGIHAAATTLMAYCRPAVFRLLTPQRGYEERMEISLGSMELQWMTLYIGILAFVHHFCVFMLEASNWGLFFNVLGKTLASTLFTIFVLIVLQYIQKRK
jgi:rod shape-determining protein MreD